MFSWLKSLIPTPKKVIGSAIDYLDATVPLLAMEIDRLKQWSGFNGMTSEQQAQKMIDKIQDLLRQKFGLNV